MINYTFEEFQNGDWVQSNRCSDFESCLRLVYAKYVDTYSPSTPEQKRYQMFRRADNADEVSLRLTFDVTPETIEISKKHGIEVS